VIRYRGLGLVPQEKKNRGIEPCFDFRNEFSCAFFRSNGRFFDRKKNERLSCGWHRQAGGTMKNSDVTHLRSNPYGTPGWLKEFSTVQVCLDAITN
jgi:hypothetical protein